MTQKTRFSIIVIIIKTFVVGWLQIRITIVVHYITEANAKSVGSVKGMNF